ncbi:hypothetical protein Tco_0444477 [Tanacetum coccineum]
MPIITIPMVVVDEWNQSPGMTALAVVLRGGGEQHHKREEEVLDPDTGVCEDMAVIGHNRRRRLSRLLKDKGFSCWFVGLKRIEKMDEDNLTEWLCQVLADDLD